MKQLSGTDSMFLQLERGNNFLHVASLGIYDPSTAPGGGVRFKDVLRFFATRVAEFPQFRRRLVSLPFSLDRPYWLQAASIDVEYHVRHIALPHPGDWRQLCIQVARLHSRPLDRSKPLWEAYVIEGLHHVDGVPPGSFALYAKMHHSMIDGESGTKLMQALHSLDADTVVDFDEEQRRAAEQVYTADRGPSFAELYGRAVANSLQRIPTMARFGLDASRRIATIGATAASRLGRSASNHDQDSNETGNGKGGSTVSGSLRALLSGDLSSLLPRRPPQTRFSGNVSAHRAFEAVALPLADFRRIRQAVPLATVNDQFLCVVGGALRVYLEAKDELPAAGLVALVPMTLRGAENGGDHGNQVGFTLMPVHTEIEDPVDRLHAIVGSAGTSKRVTDAMGKALARDLLETLPSMITDPLLRHVQLPRIGLIVSNVRGPDVPLYMAGAKLVYYAPISIAIDGLGLNVTGFSYAGNLWLCAVSCREMLPDPAFFADCLRGAFDRLKTAAQQVVDDKLATTMASPRRTSNGHDVEVKPVRTRRRPAKASRHPTA